MGIPGRLGTMPPTHPTARSDRERRTKHGNPRQAVHCHADPPYSFLRWGAENDTWQPASIGTLPCSRCATKAYNPRPQGVGLVPPGFKTDARAPQYSPDSCSQQHLLGVVCSRDCKQGAVSFFAEKTRVFVLQKSVCSVRRMWRQSYVAKM